MKRTIIAAALVFGSMAASNALAQAGNDARSLSALKQFKVATSTDLDIPLVPQEGRRADAINANLARVKLPEGFRIELYAIAPGARHMAVAPSTNMVFVGTRKTTVWAISDRDSDGVADEVKSVAPSLIEVDHRRSAAA